MTQDGHIANFPATCSAEELSEQQLLELYNNPVAQYTATDGDDIHNLYVYADGTYSTAGIIATSETAMTRGSGVTPQGNSIKVYWNTTYTDIHYNMYYFVDVTTLSSGYTKFTQNAMPYCYAYTVDITPLGYHPYANADRVYITRATQTSASSPASAYSIAHCGLEGIPTHRMKLTVNGNRGSYSVSTEILAPT